MNNLVKLEIRKNLINNVVNESKSTVELMADFDLSLYGTPFLSLVSKLVIWGHATLNGPSKPG